MDIGIVDGAVPSTETRLPSSTRPHWLEPTIYSSEEDGLSRASSDGVGGDTLNMLSVAVKIVSDKSESNTKVCILYHQILVLDLIHFSLVSQSCLTLCDPMDCSTPGFPVHHQLPELAQTHVHWVSDAIQPSHPLSSPSPPAFNLPQLQGLSKESVLCIRWPEWWSFTFSISPSNEYSRLISFRIDWLDLLAVQGTLKSLL